MMLSASFIHYAAAHKDAAPAGARLRGALVAATATPIKAQAVSDLVVTCFDRVTFDLARAWQDGSHPSRQWWEVVFNEEIPLDFDAWSIGETLEERLAMCVGVFREAGRSGGELVQRGAEWALSSSGKDFAVARPVVFTQVEEAHEQRVQKSLEGLRAYGEDEKVAARLRDIPGLSSIVHRSNGVHSDGSGPAIVNSSRSLSKALRCNVKDMLGLDISQGQSQECLATMLGFSSWNEMVALESRCGGVGQPTTIYAQDESGDLLWHRHYRSAAAALWDFGAAYRRDGRGLVVEYHGYSQMSDALMVWASPPKQGKEFVAPMLSCGHWSTSGWSNAKDLAQARDVIRKALGDAGVTESGQTQSGGVDHE